ncbi:hypothetical protein B0H14DRAFT_2564624 [Mycena olivaceomarginata]|nr:hypothetical protein B0H14DRAFT_2564624 [Mycena olivaceomarginata]
MSERIWDGKQGASSAPDPFSPFFSPQILALVADNASNNNTLVSELKYLLPSYRGSITRVRCVAHILNLVVKAILSKFSQSKGKAKIQPSVADVENEEEPDLEPDLEDSDDEEDNISEPEDSADEIEPAVEDNDNARIDEVIEEIDADPNRRVPALTAQEIKLGRYSVAKLRNLAKKIVHSPTIKADLQAVCTRSKVTPRLMRKKKEVETTDMDDVIEVDSDM